MSEGQEQKNPMNQGTENRRPQYEMPERNGQEKTIELSPRDIEARAEKAKEDALEKASSMESVKKERQNKSEQESSRHGSISKKQREKSYKQTLGHIQAELHPSDRLFSKIIHNDFIEKTSEIVASTIARPSAILSGAVVSFIISLVIYTTAKTIGYSLSGFETIASFICGWLIGIVIDYFRVLITGKIN